MPRVSLTQEEIAALEHACISRQLELTDRSHDVGTTIDAYETEDSEVTDDDLAEAEAELDEVEREADALERAWRKMVRVKKGAS